MTNGIEKRVLLKAPRSRVWRAIADSQEFGSWFGMRLDGPFVAGQRITGSIAPTTVDREIAQLQESHRGRPVIMWVEAVEPEALFSFRWHPYDVDPKVDTSREPTTLVTFRLEDAPGGVELTITETGFDKIPLERRAKAFESNDGGWTAQCELIRKYLESHAH